MQDFLMRIYRNLEEFFMGLNTNKKLGLIFIIAFVFVSLIAILTWIGKTRYEVLYTDLNREDSKKIATLLEDNKIAYQISKDGRTVKIHEEMVNKWRLQIATLGVNFSGTVGYEVFDNQSFGTTSFVQKINRQRALEGEMVKTITYIRGVRRARVHLNIPESSPFVSEKKPPTSSVVVDLERGSVLTSDEIKGIAQLISSAIEGMRPENVVIIDSRGKKLSDNIGDEMTSYTANRVALEQKINRQYENQIEEILSKVVGEGKVIAKVSVNLDFTQSVSTETTYDQGNKAVVSEVVNTQKLNGSRPSPQGIPGARSNLPGELPQPGIPETTNNVDKQLATKNYNVPSKVTKSKSPTAKIQNISVAVMLDGKKIPTLGEGGGVVLDDDGEKVMKYEPWSEADLANFSAIVVSALGINERRGDKLVIKNMEFAQEDLEEVERIIKEKENREFLKNIVKYLTIGFSITLFFLLVVRPFVKWVTDNTVEAVDDFLPKTLEELEKIQSNQKLPGLEEALPEIEEKFNPEKIEGNMLKERIISLVEANPSKGAQVIQDMIDGNDFDKSVA